MRIELGSRVFNVEQPDENGVFWYVHDWEGWDAPAQRQQVIDPAAKHGGVLTESLYGTRTVILRGIAKAPTEETFWIAYNDMLGLTNRLLDPIWLKAYEFTPKQVEVVRGGQPRLRMNGVRSFEFEVTLLATNPLKYGVNANLFPLPAGTTQNYTNAGNESTYPVVTLTSPGTVRLINKRLGQTVQTSTLASGTVLDFAARTIRSGSTNKYGTLTPTSIWWPLQPGVSAIENGGTAGVSLTYRDAWV